MNVRFQFKICESETLIQIFYEVLIHRHDCRESISVA